MQKLHSALSVWLAQKTHHVHGETMLLGSARIATAPRRQRVLTLVVDKASVWGRFWANQPSYCRHIRKARPCINCTLSRILLR
jgi:hypothetical protein